MIAIFCIKRLHKLNNIADQVTLWTFSVFTNCVGSHELKQDKFTKKQYNILIEIKYHECFRIFKEYFD